MVNTEQELRLGLALWYDPWYQKLLAQCVRAEEDYQRIRSALTAPQREKLEAYIALCEELEHRRACLAYELGKTDGKT